MKSLTIAAILVVLSATTSFSYSSGIAIQAESTSNMSVYVNGKLYNKQPGKFVRIKSLPGLFHVEVRVVNPYDKTWYVLKKDITVKKGYEVFYKVVFAKGRKPEIQAVKKYPVYSKYFRNPTLYNKNPVS